MPVGQAQSQCAPDIQGRLRFLKPPEPATGNRKLPVREELYRLRDTEADRMGVDPILLETARRQSKKPTVPAHVLLGLGEQVAVVGDAARLHCGVAVEALRHLPAPEVVDAGVVIPAAEAPGRELAVGHAERADQQIASVRERVEDVLAADRQRHSFGDRHADLQVDDGPPVQDRRIRAADELRIEEVDPVAVVVEAAEQPHPSHALVEGDVPAGPGHAPLQGEQVAGAEQIRLLRHFRICVVHREAEDGGAGERGRCPGGDDVDPLGPRGEVVDEEPEKGQRFGSGDAVGQQERAILRIGADESRQGQTIGDGDAEVVSRQRERTVVDHQPGRDVARRLGLERDAAVALRRCERGGDGAAVGELQLIVERRLHVDRVLLAGRGCAEPGAHAAA